MGVGSIKDNISRAMKLDFTWCKISGMLSAAKSQSSDKLAYVFYDKNMNKENW